MATERTGSAEDSDWHAVTGRSGRKRKTRAATAAASGLPQEEPVTVRDVRRCIAKLEADALDLTGWKERVERTVSTARADWSSASAAVSAETARRASESARIRLAADHLERLLATVSAAESERREAETARLAGEAKRVRLAAEHESAYESWRCDCRSWEAERKLWETKQQSEREPPSRSSDAKSDIGAANKAPPEPGAAPQPAPTGDTKVVEVGAATPCSYVGPLAVPHLDARQPPLVRGLLDELAKADLSKLRPGAVGEMLCDLCSSAVATARCRECECSF